MATRTASPARDETRHWLPSQGVDPAPLAELNAECLGLLAMRAAEAQGQCEGDSDSDNRAALPPLLSALRDQWAGLSAHAVRRLAAAPWLPGAPLLPVMGLVGAALRAEGTGPAFRIGLAACARCPLAAALELHRDRADAEQQREAEPERRRI